MVLTNCVRATASVSIQNFAKPITNITNSISLLIMYKALSVFVSDKSIETIISIRHCFADVL